MRKSFYFVLLTLTVGVAVVDTSSQCAGKTAVKKGKINKKLAGGTTAANNTYKYAVRMNFRYDKSWEYDDKRNGGCSGAFVSFSNSDPSKCGGRPTRYFFITAAHCFDGIIGSQMQDVHFGLSKKSSFYTIRGGSAKLTFEQLRNEVSCHPRSEPNPNAKYIIVDTTVNIIRIPIDYNLNDDRSVIHSDVAFMELSKLLYDQIVAKGGEFVRGETNAYTKDRKQLDDCVVVSMMQVARVKGTQIAAVDQIAIMQSTCGLKGKDDFECWEVLGSKPGKKVITYIEGGDSGGPFVCKSGQNEYLMTLVSSSLPPEDIYVVTPPRKKVRFYLEKAFYDDTEYYYKLQLICCWVYGITL